MEELKEVIEAVRLPLIPAEIIIESIEKSGKHKSYSRPLFL